jgi:hypothetical protein
MRKGIFLIIIFTTFLANANAQKTQTKKVKDEPFVPAVLVVGNGNAAVAAAIQSAVSGVQTVLLLQAGGFDITSPENDLSSGIQANFLKKYRQDGAAGTAFDKQRSNTILKIITDTIKNLKVIRNIMWVKAARSGNNWRFELSDGSTIKPKVLVNPSDSKLTDALKITAPTAANWAKLDYSKNSYRTSVATGKWINDTNANIFSLYQFFLPDQENLVWISDPSSMELGQAAGATAAYAAFFDTKTSLSNLKKIQGELIQYKLNIVPFSDIENTDSTWKAIQFVGITGVIKGDMDGKTLKFSPEKLVTTNEIKQPIKDYYYKAQIWFDDYKEPKMTIGSSLDMISYVGNKSLENMKKEIEKNWKAKYKFNTSFDLARQINRRELAALLQDYMPPFNVNIDKEGKVVR